MGCTILSIAFFGFFANLNLIWKLKNRAAAQPEERVNILHVNLVVFNLCIIFIAFPLPGTASLIRNWIWGDLGCYYYGSMAIFCGVNMLMTAIMICFDLVLEINLKSYVGNYKERARNAMIAYTWINSVFWTVTPFLGWSSYGFEPTGFSCTVVMKESEWFGYTTYIICHAVFVVVVPVAVLLTMFYVLYEKSVEMSPHEKTIVENKQKQVYLMIFLMFLEWTPYALYYFWPCFDNKSSITRLNAIAPLAAKASTILTPLVIMSVVDEYLNNPKPKIN